VVHDAEEAGQLMTAVQGRVRLAALAALAAAVVVGAVVLLTGSSGAAASKVGWKGEVEVFQSDIATDQVLYSQVENISLRDVTLDVEDVKVYDADGKVVRSSVRYLAAFAHGIFPWSQRPKPLGDYERRRLGEIKTIKPGQAVPITLSWRVPERGARPVRVDLGPASLALPKGPAVRP
jgi:hypothetical protein